MKESYEEQSSVIPFCYYDDIQSIMDQICVLHNAFSREWIELNNGENLLNINKKHIRHICELGEENSAGRINDVFHSIIKGYTNKLDELTVDTDLEYTYSNYDLRLRVKQPESILNKVMFYRMGKEHSGAYPINKCLNDLLGFRISIEKFDHNCSIFYTFFENIRKHYEENNIKIKINNSSKGEYKATHIYFYGDNNKYFPWEMQIWNPADAKINDKSHTLHKQDYLEWTNIYKKWNYNERRS